MNKTKATKIELFLASKELIIKFDRQLVIGRTQGDIILDEDNELSNIHCSISPMMLNLSIRDLASTNGVYVNNVKLAPNVDTTVNAGDEVSFGSQKFVFYNDKDLMYKDFPKPDKRINPRPKYIFSLKNIWNFHSVTALFQRLYIFTLLAAIVSIAINAKLNIAVPEGLKFLETFYHQKIILAGIQVVALVWAISVIHSFLHQNYFNRNISRQLMSFALYGLVIGSTVNFVHGPLWSIRSYVESRDLIIKEDLGDKNIIKLKNLLEHQNVLTKAYNKNARLLEENELRALRSDFNKLNRRVKAGIATVNQK